MSILYSSTSHEDATVRSKHATWIEAIDAALALSASVLSESSSTAFQRAVAAYALEWKRSEYQPKVKDAPSDQIPETMVPFLVATSGAASARTHIEGSISKHDDGDGDDDFGFGSMGGLLDSLKGSSQQHKIRPD